MDALLRARARAYVSAFDGADVYYAGKAFLCTAVAHWMQDNARSRGIAEIGMPVPQGSPGDRLLEALGYRVRWESWGLALLVWQRRQEAATLARWWPILVLTAIGFGVKEDVLVLAPALLVVQWVRHRVFGAGSPPSRALVVTTVT